MPLPSTSASISLRTSAAAERRQRLRQTRVCRNAIVGPTDQAAGELAELQAVVAQLRAAADHDPVDEVGEIAAAAQRDVALDQIEARAVAEHRPGCAG